MCKGANSALCSQVQIPTTARGVFDVNTRTRIADITDGTSNTFAIGEGAGGNPRYLIRLYYPDTAPVPEWQAVTTRGRSYVIGAVVDIPEPGKVEGVLFAQGSRFGGHALYVKDNRLHYLNNFLGIEEQKVVADKDVPAGEKLILSASFEKTSAEADHTAGTLTLYHGDDKVGEAEIRTQLGGWAIAGAALYVGRHEGEPLTADFPGRSPHRFTGGTLLRLGIDVSGEPYLDLEREAELMLMRE